MSAVKGHLHYARHFMVLFACAALLAAVSPWRIAPGADSAFALYGALHASAIAVSLRVAQPLWRKLLFVAIAAVLSMLTQRLGLSGVQFVGELPGLLGPLALLTLSSGIGAFAYGALIRGFGIYRYRLGALAVTALFCMAATCVAFIAAGRFHVLGGLWVAIPWWFAFSGGLWYYDSFQDVRRGGHTP
jgi:hypothetical protein